MDKNVSLPPHINLLTISGASGQKQQLCNEARECGIVAFKFTTPALQGQKSRGGLSDSSVFHDPTSKWNGVRF